MFIHPTTGTHPGVLVWPDAFGLRPAMRDIGARIAAEGYAVLVPNPFYRSAKATVNAPLFDASFDFGNQNDMAKLKQVMGSIHAPGIAEQDGAAYIAFFDAQSQVNKARKIGTHGYCMGGALVVKTAAPLPNRVGVGRVVPRWWTRHGRTRTTRTCLAPKIKARMYFGIAANDDSRQPDAKDELKKAFSAANVPAEIEVYPGALHGWCVPDMPPQNGMPVYNKPDAEKAWAKLVALYKAALA